MASICSIEDCGKPHKGHGYCKLHLARLRKYGDPLYTRPTPTCSVDGCDKPRRGGGREWCGKHYQRWTKYGDPNATVNTRLSRIGTCAVVDCTNKIYAKRLCSMHYQRVLLGGTVGEPEPRHVFSDQERLERYTQKTGSDCWHWIGPTNKKGYGLIGHGSLAHRVAYQRYVGEIPSGLEIDHLCENRRCVNPRHLEAVTHAENVRRARNRQELLW